MNFRRLAVLGLALVALSPISARAASYQLMPISGSYPVGATFTVAINVNASDEAINAVSGKLSFPASLLSVVSISKSGTIVDLWVQEPSFSNANGTINFEGIVLNPGFTGASGHVMSVTFRTRTEGSPALSFSAASVLANDGQGTNVLVGLARSAYTIRAGAPVPATPKPQVPVAPGLPSGIRSLTHPEEDVWYNSPRAAFDWDAPSGVIGTLYDLDRSPTSAPVTELAGRAASTEVSLDSWPGDGTYYFHLRFRTADGLTPVLHRKISVDRTPPRSLVVKEVKSDDPTDPAIILELSAADDLSGIAAYSFLGPSGIWEELDVDDMGGTELRAWQPGEQSIRVRAVDGAGNAREEEVPLYRKPLESPVITSAVERVNSLIDSAKELVSGDGMVASVRGTTEVGRKVSVQFALGGTVRHEVEAAVDSDGNWRAVYPDLEPGEWQVSATARDARGAMSLPSDVREVTSYGQWSRLIPVIGWVLIGVLAVFALGIGLVAEYQFVGRVQDWLAGVLRRRDDER